MRAAIALGVIPCSTSVTMHALKTIASPAVGSRPMSSRNAMPPKSTCPSNCEGKS
jgi:hypothetical protein